MLNNWILQEEGRCSGCKDPFENSSLNLRVFTVGWKGYSLPPLSMQIDILVE